MAILFYPHENDLQTSSLEEKLEVMVDAAERYKAAILDAAARVTASTAAPVVKRAIPKDLTIAFDWEEMTRILREVRELSEASNGQKAVKADRLTKLAEIYETLRAAKMPKLEAVRLALTNEANQLKASAAA